MIRSGSNQYLNELLLSNKIWILEQLYIIFLKSDFSDFSFFQPSLPKSSKSSVVDAATNSRGVWSIKETAMSGKRSEPRLEPEPPKMVRECWHTFYGCCSSSSL